MSTPRPGGWPPPQQPGQPPSQGQPYGQPYDPSGYNAQQPPPPGWQQGAWAPHSAPPPQKGNSLKWLLIGVAVLLVVAISVGATLLFTRDGNAGGGTTTSGSPSDVASANDTGPVSVITDEPTCNTFMGINNGIADLEGNGWAAQRGALGPSTEWSPAQRQVVDTVSRGIRNAADQVVPLAKQTPHRLVREMYEQYIVYGRAYADSVSDYTPDDNFLASANVNIGTALFAMCNAITYGSTGRSLGVDAVPSPTRIAPIADASNPQRFISASDTANCRKWVDQETRFVAETADWSNLDAAIPASEWTSEQRALQQAVIPTLSRQSDYMERAGQQSKNPILEDFAIAATIYLRAYLTTGDTYVEADGWLSNVAFRLNNAIGSACQAPGG